MEWSGSGSEVTSSKVNLKIADNVESSSRLGRTGVAPKTTCQMSSSLSVGQSCSSDYLPYIHCKKNKPLNTVAENVGYS